MLTLQCYLNANFMNLHIATFDSCHIIGECVLVCMSVTLLNRQSAGCLLTVLTQELAGNYN